ncbi:hypothetical protein OIU84_027809 [Salix udensis]|uniref:peroxidase n=1 Tax=Salix udensis TaxID=889485 RepID=A0AAD6KG46_9ROSI|nr:hypothetical protein OIU84_027809 [Salix udensis]
MAMANFLALFLLMELIAGGYRDGANGLSMNYYVFSCPFAEPIVRNTVASALQSDPTLAAGLVRMHFHDCWIQGCDGSVLLDSTKNNTAEKESAGNLSVREVQYMTYQKEEKMEGGLKLKILSARLPHLLMHRSSLGPLASVVSVPETWLPCPGHTH